MSKNEERIKTKTMWNKVQTDIDSQRLCQVLLMYTKKKITSNFIFGMYMF